MAGEGQLKEQANYQWDRLDTEGCKLISKILTATPEKVKWPEGTEPKFTRMHFFTSAIILIEKNTLGLNYQPD